MENVGGKINNVFLLIYFFDKRYPFEYEKYVLLNNPSNLNDFVSK